MSYEGYVRILCTKGHLSEEDVYIFTDDNSWRCPICGEKLAWRQGCR